MLVITILGVFSMKIVWIHGGLGNQMFQYAFYCYLKANYSDVKLDITKYEHDKCHHGFELEKVFNIKADLATLGEIELLKNSNKTFVQEKQYNYDKKILNLKGDRYYKGLWQTEKYFKSITAKIRKEFEFKEPLLGKNAITVDKITAQNSLSLHIRRGDYLTSDVHKGISNIRYYIKAIDLLKKRVKNPFLYIFSDDIDWVKQNFRFSLPSIYVDWNQGKNSYRDMQLMSLCKHNIIANSTFSWWGAWLNKNDQKKVIAPAKWFNYDFVNTNDVVPKEWLKVSI